MERSGRGAKLGNRYEGRWVARQLLMVIAGKLRSVRVEALGDDERGVDLWITHNDGTPEAQQCKAANRNEGRWPIAELARRGVLAYLKLHLSANATNRYTLVSGVDAPDLHELADRAKSSASWEAFHDHQITAKGMRTAFGDFCRAVKLDPTNESDIAVAWDLLQRTGVHIFPRSGEEEQQLDLTASLLLTGASTPLIVAYLADFATENSNFDKELYADMLLTELRKHGVYPRDLSGDPRLAPRIEELRDEFACSIRSTLIGGQLIARIEAEAVITRLLATDGKPIVVVHGRAGDGKSGVLLQVVDELNRRGIPVLPLRLDRRLPRSSAQSWGQELELPDSPAISLRALAGNRPAVILLDQLDALRWTAAHASAAWETCQQVVAQARASGNLRVVIACRTFDWQEDPLFRHWGDRNACDEVPVAPLADEQVKKIVDGAGGSHAGLDSRQRTLLRSAVCLSLWATLQRDGQAPAAFRTQTELMKAFWCNRKEKMREASVLPSDAEAILDALVAHMDEKGCLAAPSRLLDRLPDVARQLKSLNLVTVANGKVSFAHQSYLDFLVAERVLDEMGGDSVVAWLKNHDQSLFRREQLRQVLLLLRDEDAHRYHATLETILADSNTRFHLKHLVLQHLGQCDPPTPAEVGLAARLLEEPYWRDHIRSLALFRSPAWFKAMYDTGIFQRQLASPDESVVNGTLWLMWGAVETYGDEVAVLLKPYLNALASWPVRMSYVVNLHECENSRALFEIRRDLVRSGTIAEHDLYCDKLANKQPTWCAEFLESRLMAMIDGWPDAIMVTRADRDKVFPIILDQRHSALDGAATAAPMEFWDRLVSCVERLATLARRESSRKSSRFFRDDIWYGTDLLIGNDEHEHDIVQLLTVLDDHHPVISKGRFSQ